MSELAFNYKGKRFSPPREARFWGVRRFRDGQRGALDVVLDKDGLPLIVPIENGIDEFGEAVDHQPARYRLDALDAAKMALPKVEAAYVTVPGAVSDEHDELDLEPDFDDTGMPALAPCAPSRALRNGVGGNVATATASYPASRALPMPDAMTGVEYLLAEALHGVVQMGKQQGDSHVQQLGQLAAMVQSTLAAIPPLLLATTAHAEREQTLLVNLLLQREGITPPTPPPPPAPVAPPPPAAPPPPPPIFVAMPRNAMFADEAPDQDEDSDSDDNAGDDAATEAQGEDFFTKATKLVASVGQAVAPVAEVAKMVMGAGLGGLGGMFGGGDSPRNAADAAPPAELASDEPEAGDPLSHLRVSHMLAISYELGAKDGSIFRRMFRAMEPADRAMFTTRLCALPLDEAVRLAAEQVEWLKARMARSHEACEAQTEVGADAHQEHETAEHDDADIDTAPADDTDHHQEHDTTQHDETDLDAAPADDQDDHTDQEHDTTQHDTRDRDPAPPDADPEPAEHTATEPEGRPMPPTRTVATTAAVTTSVATTSATVPEAPRPVTPDVVAHMKLIAKHLGFPAILQAQALINNTSIAERNAWIERLMALAPAEAAAVVRAELARRAGQ